MTMPQRSQSNTLGNGRLNALNVLGLESHEVESLFLYITVSNLKHALLRGRVISQSVYKSREVSRITSTISTMPLIGHFNSTER